MKTIKALIKLLRGQFLDVKDLRRLDSLWFEIKCIFLTIVVVMMLLWLLWIVGTFEGVPYYKYYKK